MLTVPELGLNADQLGVVLSALHFYDEKLNDATGSRGIELRNRNSRLVDESIAILTPLARRP